MEERGIMKQPVAAFSIYRAKFPSWTSEPTDYFENMIYILTKFIRLFFSLLWLKKQD